jgi:glutamyl-tRNA synthetase
MHGRSRDSGSRPRISGAIPPGGVTRLAPSPTGALHLGNVRTFAINWALARRHGWWVLLRIEDLDTPRVKPGAIEQTVDLLAWIGLDWDEGPSVQSADLEPYRDAMRRLAGAGLVYPCALTRREIEAAASAPHRGDHEVAFPAGLRPASFTPGEPTGFDREDVNWRFAVDPGEVAFEDGVRGDERVDVSRDVGDFVVWTKRGQPAYQLAVVVDDGRAGVDRIVRGDDLVASTGRQLLLYRALGLGPEPAYWHVPLVLGADGRRLAKRHGDTRLETYREAGVPAERVLGLIGAWCGIGDEPTEMTAAQFGARFEASDLPRGDIVWREADDLWLRSG